jgi:hypothetical protein
MATDIAGLTTSLATALATVQASIASVPSVSGASQSFLQTLATQVSTALGLAQQVLAYWDTTLAAAGAPANFASGADPADMVASVDALLLASTNITWAFDCANKLGRLLSNIEAIGT